MTKLWVAVYLLLLAGAAALGYQNQRLEASLAKQRAISAEMLQAAEARARQIEQQMAAQTEKVANEVSMREQVLVGRAAAVERVNRGLRDEVARLNSRPAPANPESAAFADEASAARQLLGECADEYRAVATDADRLRDQVTGLQHYVRGVLGN
jgi:hypothetical protein